jgi:hypothetical protein
MIKFIYIGIILIILFILSIQFPILYPIFIPYELFFKGGYILVIFYLLYKNIKLKKELEKLKNKD